ncbi:hypothetical protein F8O06_02255 [Pseudoclavibacter sp. CFCC 14310]|nr:hypothetical protein F8O06_02255 [Pseudoclavibacter sp. CFCC 14310]
MGTRFIGAKFIGAKFIGARFIGCSAGRTGTSRLAAARSRTTASNRHK